MKMSFHWANITNPKKQHFRQKDSKDKITDIYVQNKNKKYKLGCSAKSVCFSKIFSFLLLNLVIDG